MQHNTDICLEEQYGFSCAIKYFVLVKGGSRRVLFGQ